MIKLLDIIPKVISDEDMEQLIRDWNLSDSDQRSCYKNAVPKQHKMLMDAPVIKQKEIDLKERIHWDNW